MYELVEAVEAAAAPATNGRPRASERPPAHGTRRMAGTMSKEDQETFRMVLENLRARLRGDLDQMTDEALMAQGGNASGNLSNLPIHMADVGTENYDQEFTLGLIENEQETLEQINGALDRIAAGNFGLCEMCSGPIARPRLQALPYTRYCIDCARKAERGE